MTQDAGNEDGTVDDGRARRRGLLPLALLVVLIAVILWLISQFLGRLPETTEVSTVGSPNPVETTAPPGSPEPESPLADDPTVTEEDGPRVPDVVGDSQALAVSELEGAGYVARPTYVYSDSTPFGAVVQQNPSAGSILSVGSVVNIFISRGTQTIPLVTMPNVIGLSQAEATAKVKAAGLKPYILYGTDRTYGANVFNQWPLGGTRLPKGSEGFIQVPKG